MQMNTEDTPAQDPVVQVVATKPTTTLHLDFGGVTDDGQQFVTSILQCGNPAEIAQWVEDNTGETDAHAQALVAIQANSTGEYASKTVGSIGTVNYQLQQHEHEIAVLMGQGIKNEKAVVDVAKDIREEIEAERGNVTFCRRTLVDFEKQLKGETKARQDEIKTLKDEIKTLRDANETLQKEMKAQYLVMQNVVKKVTGEGDNEITQASPPRSYPQEQFFSHCPQWMNELRLQALEL